MDELVELVAKKTGLPKAQAKVAVDTVLNFVKEKLPDQIADRLDDILEGADGLDMDKGLDMLGGLFGKK